MYGRRVAKNHPRIEAVGTIDELNAALGLARASSLHALIGDNLAAIQKDLIVLMGELSVHPDDQDRYVSDGYGLVKPDMTAVLDRLVRQVEGQNLHSAGWATPGGNMGSACLDVARTVCRRAERRVTDLKAAGELQNPEIVVYLNRLSDLLWLLARWMDANQKPARA